MNEKEENWFYWDTEWDFKMLEYLNFVVIWDKVEIYETLDYYLKDTYTKEEFKLFKDKIDKIYNLLIK